MGTAGYMSPEQVRGQRVDHRSDVFSLGLILYEMLSGRRAFHGDSAVETLNAILEEPPELSGQTVTLIRRWSGLLHCLKKIRPAISVGRRCRVRVGIVEWSVIERTMGDEFKTTNAP